MRSDGGTALRVAVAALALALLFTARAAHAQERCTPQSTTWCAEVLPNGTIRMRPPPVQVRVDPPPVHVQVDPRLQAEADARARADAIELQRRLSWQAYFDFEARVRFEVEAQIRARVAAEASLSAQRTPDPFLTTAPPRLGANPDRAVSYPRVELAALPFCGAVFTGPGSPYHVGFCPPVRVRFDDTWGIALDPSFLWQGHGDIEFHTLGFHPAATFAFAHGRGKGAGSHAYLRAGGDAWLPLDGGTRTPDLFLGAHVGLGVHYQASDVLGLGMEMRGLLRGGTSDADQGMSRIRAGAEARLYVIALTF